MSTITKLQQRIDELILQLELGKREAVDRVEQAKDNMHSFLKSTEKHIAKPVAEKFGELRVQLELGRMESKNSYHHQREKIAHALDEAKEAVKQHGHEADAEFHDLADSLSDRMELLALNLELAKDSASEKAVETKENLKEKLGDLSEKAREAKAATSEKARETSEECKVAVADIRSNLRTLFS